MLYEVVANNFKGPIHKLLEFIEEKKYEITEINLAEITGDFLEYLKIVENKEPRLLSDFIAVAAKLVLIKSKSLIPDLRLTPEEEEGIKDLENRLKLYKAIKIAEKNFSDLWLSEKTSFMRDPFILKRSPVFTPSPDITAVSLLHAITTLQSSSVALKTQYEKYETVNFAAYVEELILRINQSASDFNSITGNRKKKEVIILFLALLQLLKDNKVSITQDTSFSAITITTNNHNEP